MGAQFGVPVWVRRPVKFLAFIKKRAVKSWCPWLKPSSFSFVIQEPEELPSLPHGSLDEEEQAYQYAESISVDILPEGQPSNGMESREQENRGQSWSEKEQEENKAEKSKQLQIPAVEAQDRRESNNLEKTDLTLNCKNRHQAANRDLARCAIYR